MELRIQTITIQRSDFARIFSYFLLTILFSCVSPQQPQRIYSIPKTAFWIGGPDGGVWFDVGTKNDFSWPIRIYNDYTGQLIDSGIFVVCHNCKNVTFADIVSQIDFYDGERIRLKQKVSGRNCYLIKVDN